MPVFETKKFTTQAQMQYSGKCPSDPFANQDWRSSPTLSQLTGETLIKQTSITLHLTGQFCGLRKRNKLRCKSFIDYFSLITTSCSALVAQFLQPWNLSFRLTWLVSWAAWPTSPLADSAGTSAWSWPRFDSTRDGLPLETYNSDKIWQNILFHHQILIYTTVSKRWSDSGVEFNGRFWFP